MTFYRNGFFIILAILFLSGCSIFFSSDGFMWTSIVHAQEEETLETGVPVEDSHIDDASPAVEDTEEPGTVTESPDGESEGVEKPGQTGKGEKGETEGEKKESKISDLQIKILLSLPVVAGILIIVYFAVTGQTFRASKQVREAAVDMGKKKSKKSAGPKKGEKKLPKPVELLHIDDVRRLGPLHSIYVLECIQGHNVNERFPITKHLCTIGRRSTNGRINDIQLSSYEKRVSRNQALLAYIKEEGRFYIINETDVPMFVSGNRITDAYPLDDNDTIEMGGSTVTLKLIKKDEKKK